MIRSFHNYVIIRDTVVSVCLRTTLVVKKETEGKLVTTRVDMTARHHGSRRSKTRFVDVFENQPVINDT